jgi:3-isopropylmalate/(R)-2-methylmalate dehydratase small subunit
MTGKVWAFGDNINTDLIAPGGMLAAPERQRALAVFSANRPGWSALVTPGDIVVAGTNFGTGSSRPAAQSLRALGIACVLAESLNGLFFRNAVNYGFCAFACPGVTSLLTEGQTARVSTADWTVTNEATGAQLPLTAIPASLLALMTAGGIFPELERRGLIKALG